ncbi:MAG: SMC family ATPase [SAR202 cluster bacterium]|nr:SMC family ATPase [SAR202 cluster bacterium]
MIPTKLTLENFLSYKGPQPPLDFTGIHVACLSGANGHGKSALLDAVTWALWGEARSKFDDYLIHFGQDHMSVELEFQARGGGYKVIRRRSRTARRGSGKSDLQLQISAGDAFTPITGDSIAQTQAKIEQLIGMDYKTFINSSFLIQGRADEFTNKPPGERKEVLAKVLGLDRFDEMQERSRQRAQEHDRQAAEIEAALAYLTQEAAHKDEYQQSLAVVNADLQTLASAIDAATLEADALRREVMDLEQKARQAQDLEARLPGLQSELQHFLAEIRQQEARISGYRALVTNQDTIQAGFAEYQSLLKQYEAMDSARRHYDTLNNKAVSLKQAIAQAKARLEEREKFLKQRLTRELEPKAQARPAIEARIIQAKATMDSLGTEEAAIAQERTRLQAVAVHLGQAAAELESLAVEGKELRSKLNVLQASPLTAQCPLCNTPLGQDRCRDLIGSYKTEIDRKLADYRTKDSQLKELKAEKAKMDREIPQRDATLKQRQQQTQRQIATLEKELQESSHAAAEAETLRAESKTVKAELASESHAPQQRQELAAVEAQVAGLTYSPEGHSKLFRQVQDYQPYIQKHAKLSEALEALPREEASLWRSKSLVEQRRKEQSQIGETVAHLRTQAAGLAGRKQKLLAVDSQLQESRSKQQSLLASKGGLEDRLRKVEEAERQAAHKRPQAAGLRDEQSVYSELSQAFGKKGVQALLIETVLPYIEEYANELLRRMSDGRMNVKLETQQELKSRRGEFTETLEIKISDELGPRSYEMFSGGEAFRINLALRIALSKALAHRSGAPLPTLFIDEGFGTQDATGRERILDVIHAIEPDFQRIIVITHLDDLKEAFPVRIEVEKRNGASTAWIS